MEEAMEPSEDVTLIKKRKRLSLTNDKSTEVEALIDSKSDTTQKRRKAPNDRKKDIFKSWLRMRQKGRSNPAIEDEVRTLSPEDLYGHFLDFLPEDLEEFDEQLRFERTCAEDALL